MRSFWGDESGTVPAEWMYLFAALVAAVATSLALVTTGILNVGGNISASIATIEPGLENVGSIRTNTGVTETTIQTNGDDPLDGWQSNGCLYDQGVLLACQ